MPARPANDTDNDNKNEDEEVWPPSRVYFRTAEDFDGHEEWEWLLRHHGQDPPLPMQTCECTFKFESRASCVAVDLTVSFLSFLVSGFGADEY